jgi:hypothetical protein
MIGCVKGHQKWFRIWSRSDLTAERYLELILIRLYTITSLCKQIEGAPHPTFIIKYQNYIVFCCRDVKERLPDKGLMEKINAAINRTKHMDNEDQFMVKYLCLNLIWHTVNIHKHFICVYLYCLI